MCPDTTVWMNARTVPAVNQTVVYLAEAGNALSFNTRVYGEK